MSLVTTIATTYMLGSTLVISPGRPTPVRISGPQVWISDSKIVEVQALEGPKALLIGRADEGEVFVYGLAETAVNRVVISTAGNLRALQKCGPSNFEIAADGSLRSSQWNAEIARVIERCGYDKVSIQNPDLLLAPLNERRAELARLGLSVSHATPRNGRLLWHLPRAKFASLQKALGPLSALSEWKEATSEVSSTISFRLDLFEFSRSHAEALGVEWPTHTSLESARLSSDIDLSVLHVDASQSGRLLASPHLRTMPGKTAIFNSGGEIPIQDAQAFGAKTSWKAYGLKILLTPRADASPLQSEVMTTVEIEYSQPDYGNAQKGVPALVTRNLKNEFALGMNKTTLLTSMLQVRSGTSERGVWGLSSLPLLGALFKSESSNRDENELWFLISPTWATGRDHALPEETSKTWSRYGKSSRNPG